MSEEVVKWITEIRTLQERLTQVQQECDKANASATNWRNLYASEARQRRRETRLTQDKVEQLQGEIQQLKSRNFPRKLNNPETLAAIKQELSKLKTVKQLKIKLIEVIQEREKALQAWKMEQAKHEQTRKSLTNVLGDTVDKLVKQSSLTKQ